MCVYKNIMCVEYLGFNNIKGIYKCFVLNIIVEWFFLFIERGNMFKYFIKFCSGVLLN